MKRPSISKHYDCSKNIYIYKKMGVLEEWQQPILFSQSPNCNLQLHFLQVYFFPFQWQLLKNKYSQPAYQLSSGFVYLRFMYICFQLGRFHVIYLIYRVLMVLCWIAMILHVFIDWWNKLLFLTVWVFIGLGVSTITQLLTAIHRYSRKEDCVVR